MAARREAADRKRRMQARIGAGVAAVVVLGAIIWIVVATTGGSNSTPVASGPAPCVWTPAANPPNPSPSPSASPTKAPPGLPPTDVPHKGYQVMTLTTSAGVIKIEMDLSKTPCTAASMAFLASKKYYDGTSCHRLVTDIFALQCGDPTGTGSGGPGYQFKDENTPTDKNPAYRDGDVAMANAGPNTNGSQFFFLYGTPDLPGNYSLFGRVTKGLDIVKAVGAGGDDGAFTSAGGGHPKLPLQLLTVTAGPASTAGTTPAASGTTSAAGGATGALATRPTVAKGTGTLTKLAVTTLVPGTGPAVKAGQTITVNYVGAFYATGEVFDSSWAHGSPASFAIGVGQVIQGWDRGLVGVKVGSRVQLDIPQSLGYPDANASNGQPAGPLRFVVDILSAS
jgi:peptidyl-prolyl cis-trans isomerase B (cyclophilin B)